MGQVLHGSARTTAAVRRAIQHSQESLNTLAERYDINPKTVAKWKKRTDVHDAPMGPTQPRSTALTPEQEALCVAFRRHTLLPLDDCLYALQSSIPRLTRSSWHRCFQRHGISRLPEVEGALPAKKKFKKYPLGYFHIDIAEVHTEEGRLYLFVAIDRASKFAVAELHEKATRRIAANFLRARIAAVPYTIHTVLTDNGTQFTELVHFRTGAKKQQKAQHPEGLYLIHAFDYACEQYGIEHRLTKPGHPWTNGQVERMNRTLKDATVKRYYYESHQELKEHLYNVLNAYNFAKRLKTLQGLTPYEYIIKCWQREPERFKLNPAHHTVGLNTLRESK
jgi:transposase InsO family protein